MAVEHVSTDACRGVVVDGVDTTAFVRAELDRRSPESGLREARTAEDLRAVWNTVDRRWPRRSPAPSGCPRACGTCGWTTSGHWWRRCGSSSSPSTCGWAGWCEGRASRSTAQPVRECLRVVIDEHIEHRRYGKRDLEALETRSTE